MDLWQRKPTLSSGYALGLGRFTAINPWLPCYNYYIFRPTHNQKTLEHVQNMILFQHQTGITWFVCIKSLPCFIHDHSGETLERNSPGMGIILTITKVICISVWSIGPACSTHWCTQKLVIVEFDFCPDIATCNNNMMHSTQWYTILKQYYPMAVVWLLTFWLTPAKVRWSLHLENTFPTSLSSSIDFQRACLAATIKVWIKNPALTFFQARHILHACYSCKFIQTQCFRVSSFW